ncbi:hypothetical protein [Thauera phenolivorans]|uniref:hypothetical protein n=1 Tax=Thauera phenolivorans TaxID=1792543 RepID=UPI00083A629A|nr:hypothetical protein [Thauera phenolivorans]
MKRKPLATLLTAVALAFTAVAGPGLAAGESHEHDSHAPALKLDAAGHKWQTDAPLREGMQKIRASVERELPAVHAGTLAPAASEALGGAVEAQVAYIVANCKLTPQADEVLHGIIAELGEAADLLAGKTAVTDRSAGAARLVSALDDYGRYFDHPGWTPIERDH